MKFKIRTERKKTPDESNKSLLSLLNGSISPFKLLDGSSFCSDIIHSCIADS